MVAPGCCILCRRFVLLAGSLLSFNIPIPENWQEISVVW